MRTAVRTTKKFHENDLGNIEFDKVEENKNPQRQLH